MSNKELIIKLIQQDLKHCQLLYGLDRVGLNGEDKHHLQIFDMVSELMKVPESIEIDWGSVYHDYMKKSTLIEITSTAEPLKPLAELCFKELKDLIDNDKRMK